jgi:hypothetical protein
MAFFREQCLNFFFGSSHEASAKDRRYRFLYNLLQKTLLSPWQCRYSVMYYHISGDMAVPNSKKSNPCLHGFTGIILVFSRSGIQSGLLFGHECRCRITAFSSDLNVRDPILSTSAPCLLLWTVFLFPGAFSFAFLPRGKP